MYLKKIIIQGFKSFAHSTTIDFSPGLNVIVGPNGSGKSNLIDALRWVWGNKMRELRITRNREVIFHGSETVKPLGMADIELWWEDLRGTDLKMGRRVFASGESEYFLEGEKVSWGEWRENLEQEGLEIERLSTGVVGSEELQALLNQTPPGRWQWLEMVSGAGEWKKKLSQVSLRLEKIESRRKLLEERLKELGPQMERWRLWAEEEEEYLSVEKEWREIRALYIQKMVESSKERLSLLKSEREIEEEEIKKKEEEKRKWEGTFSSLSRARYNCQVEKKNIEKEKEEKEGEKRREEEKLYYILTEMRESKKAALQIREKLAHWEAAIGLLEERKKSWEEYFPLQEEGENNQERLMLQLREKEKALRELEKKNIHLREGKRYLEEEEEKAEARLRDKLQKEKRIKEELLVAKRRIKEGEEGIQKRERAIEKGKEEEKTGRENLERSRVILQSISRKINSREKREREGHREWEKGLNAQGWSKRAIQALSWFWEYHNLKGEDFNLESSPEVGCWYVSPSVEPPAFWRECQKKEVFHLFHRGELPEENLVASDGSLIFLRSGFLLFPGQLISSSEPRFYQSWRQREKRWQDKVDFWEKKVENVVRERKKEEERLWKDKLEVEREKEKLLHREKEEEEVEREINQLRKEIEIIVEKKDTGEKEIIEIEEELRKIKIDISQIQSQIEEKERERKKREKAEIEKERFRWEVESLRKELREGWEVLKKEEKERVKYGERLKEEGNKIWAVAISLQGKKKELQEKEEEEKNLREKIDLATGKIREIEKEKEEKERKLEKILILEEKLSGEVAELSRELERLGEEHLCSTFTSKEVSIKELELSLKEKEELLQKKRIIPGAGEEFARVGERFAYLSEKNEQCKIGLQLVREGISLGQREVKKNFQEFLYGVDKSFSNFFTEIFPGGEARLILGEEEAEIEVRLPGKRKQSLSLLSSGEKALVALCFLFAAFEAADLPFCFLDEVDANLDHTNSLLLARLLRNISQTRQVVVVTHQEEVMEAAERIIGITMNDPGVSQAICFDGESFQ